jgi:hypothetical protein
MDNGIGALFESPLFQFGMNMLAGTGYSDKPQTLSGGIGAAMQQTMQQQRQRRLLEMEEEKFKEEKRLTDLQYGKIEQAQKLAERKAKIAQGFATNLRKNFADHPMMEPVAEVFEAGDLDTGLSLLKEFGTKEPGERIQQAMIIAKETGRSVGDVLLELSRGGGTTVNIGGTDYGSTQPGWKIENKGTPQEQMAPVKGAPTERLSMDEAAKMSGYDNAIKATADLNGLLFDKDGSVNRAAVAQYKAGIGVGKTIHTLLTLAMKQKKLAETGLAATDQEAEEMASAYAPSLMDTAESLQTKLRVLDEFLVSAKSNFMRGRDPNIGGVKSSGATGTWDAPGKGAAPPVDIRKKAEAIGLTLE